MTAYCVITTVAIGVFSRLVLHAGVVQVQCQVGVKRQDWKQVAQTGYDVMLPQRLGEGACQGRSPQRVVFKTKFQTIQMNT